MKTKTSHRFLLAATVACGLTLPAFAGGDEPNAPAPALTPGAAQVTVSPGLLGESFAGLSYRYVDLDAPAGHADAYRFEFNEAIKTGYDGLLSFDWTDGAASEWSISTGLRAYCPDLAWGKPYAEANVGYIRQKAAGAKDDSFLWSVAIGAEFRVAPAVTVTPFIRYDDAPGLARSGRWDFGVKANYWIDRQWSVTVGLDRDDDRNTGFMVGTNFRY